MLTLESLNLDKPLSVFLAVGLADKALPIWEGEYPEDMRPRKAIEAAKEWLSNPCDAAASAARAAAAAARTAAVSAANAATAARTAAAATAAARPASYAITHYAAANAANAANAATAANAYSAARALEADKKSLIHKVILENLDWILQYKIESGQSFAQPELILNYLDEEKKQSFLFNLDSVA